MLTYACIVHGIMHDALACRSARFAGEPDDGGVQQLSPERKRESCSFMAAECKMSDWNWLSLMN